MWLRQAFPASHSQWQASKEAKKMKGTSGRKRSNVFAMFDPDTRSWKTSQVCLILDTSAKSSLRWPKQGSMQDGVCSEQTMWEPRIDAKDSGYWRTPSAQEPGVTVERLVTKDGGPPKLGQRLYDKETGRLAQVGLTQQVKMCKTPSAADAYTGNMKKDEFKFGNSGSLAQEVESGFLETHRMWPTPSVSDTEGGQQSDRVEQTQSGTYILRKKNKPDSTFGAKLSDAVLFEEKKMWPTPTTQEIEHPDMELTETGRRKPKRGKTSHSMNLADSVKMWPTPTVQDSNKATKRWREDHQNNLTAAVFNPERMFPTPTTRDYKGGYKTESLTRKDGKSRAMDLLPNAVLDGKGVETSTGGQLNPTWVEWLMGWPLGWTDLKPLETDKYQQWLQLHGCC